MQDHVVITFPSIHSSLCVENSLSGYTPKYQQWLPLRIGFRGKGEKVFGWTFNFLLYTFHSVCSGDLRFSKINRVQIVKYKHDKARAGKC